MEKIAPLPRPGSSVVIIAVILVLAIAVFASDCILFGGEKLLNPKSDSPVHLQMVTQTTVTTIPQTMSSSAGGNSYVGSENILFDPSQSITIVSDSFHRSDLPACSLGTADLALGGSGNYYYLPIFGGGPASPNGARIVSGELENIGNDYGGVQLTTSANACNDLRIRGENMGQDLHISADLKVPANGDLITQAGPYFRSRPAAAGDGIRGGDSAGYWVQLHSTGKVTIQRLDNGAVVATTEVPATFNPATWHTLELTAKGTTLKVTVDGGVLTFTQNGTTTTTVSIPATGGTNSGTAGIAFGAETNRGQAGGQHADNFVVQMAQ